MLAAPPAWDVMRPSNALTRYQIPPNELKDAEQYRDTLTLQAKYCYVGAVTTGLVGSSSSVSLIYAGVAPLLQLLVMLLLRRL